MRAPSLHRHPGLPARVEIYEVGARDGLQNEPTIVSIATKAAFIARLVAAGLRTVEATSFVSPKWVPQLSDAEDLFPLLTERDTARYPVLVPNLAGLERARAAGAEHIAVFASATETFARRNLNRTLDESLEMFAPVITAARQSGIWVLDQFTRWQALNWDYSGRLQKAQMDVVELTPGTPQMF